MSCSSVSSHGSAASVAVVLFRLLDAAESDQRLAPRFLRSHPCAQVVLDVHLQMRFQLGREFAVAPPLAEQPAESHEPRTQRAHHDSSLGVRNRARIAVVCSHSRSSFSMRFRPARVSL